MSRPTGSVQIAFASLIGIIVQTFFPLLSIIANYPGPRVPNQYAEFFAGTCVLAAATLPLVWWRNAIGYVAAFVVGGLSILTLILVLGGVLGAAPPIPGFPFGPLWLLLFSVTLIVSTVIAWSRKA